jgi:hypothetical protein
MNITIEKNIPMPERGIGTTGTLKAMSVGDSVVVLKDKVPNWRAIASKNRLKITVRPCPPDDFDDGEDHCRVWRVS